MALSLLLKLKKAGDLLSGDVCFRDTGFLYVSLSLLDWLPKGVSLSIMTVPALVISVHAIQQAGKKQR